VEEAPKPDQEHLLSSDTGKIISMAIFFIGEKVFL